LSRTAMRNPSSRLMSPFAARLSNN
jgi:hypothetical protein